MKKSILIIALCSFSTGVIVAAGSLGQTISLTILKPSAQTNITQVKLLLPGQRVRSFSFDKEFYPTMELPSGQDINVIIKKGNGKHYETSFTIPEFDESIKFTSNALYINNIRHVYKSRKKTQ